MKREDGVLLESWGAERKEEVRLHGELVIRWSTFPKRDWYPIVVLTETGTRALLNERAAPADDGRITMRVTREQYELLLRADAAPTGGDAALSHSTAVGTWVRASELPSRTTLCETGVKPCEEGCRKFGTAAPGPAPKETP